MVLAPRPWRQVTWVKARVATVAKEAVHRGEHEGNRKTIARGKPGCLGCTCQIRVHSFSTSAHGDADAVGARLSLRPLTSEGAKKVQNPGENLPRERERMHFA